MSITLQRRTNINDSGYFRIGDVILDIPPESIQTDRMSNNEEIVTLRSSQAFYKKTGHELFNVTISWKALVDYTLAGPDYSQWDKLRRVLAFFRAAPFIEIENKHLRQIILSQDSSRTSYDRM